MSGYYYTIPAIVFYDKKLSANAKLIAAMVANFCDKYGVCTVTNKHLGDVLGKSERSLSRIISELAEQGYISVKVDTLDNTKRYISLTEKMGNAPTTKMTYPHDKNDVPPRQKCLHNNTIYNSTIINIKYNVEIDEIVTYLNENTNSQFKPKNQNTIKLISGRINDGYTVEDFKKVIDTMKVKWANTEYEQYLTPDTLFRPTNFEKYLNFANKKLEPIKKPIIRS